MSSLLNAGWLELLDYLSAHVLTCLVPAFFIAGAIAVFVSGPNVLKYFGAGTNRLVSYSVASVSGIILSVCSCTVLPLFAGIYRKGAGLGPAVTFLYSAPAINLLAITLTGQKLGWELGFARALGAIIFAIVIGIIMAFLFKGEQKERSAEEVAMFSGSTEEQKPAWVLLLYFSILVLILIVGSLNQPLSLKLSVWGLLIAFLMYVLYRWFDGEEVKLWLSETYKLAKLITPILLVGVFFAGVLREILPPEWIATYVGDNGWGSTFTASLIGAMMYFSTMTEVPIVRALMDLGMSKGAALALLLAGPALSLPNMLVIGRVMGVKKTAVYISLVVVLATLTGWLFGNII